MQDDVSRLVGIDGLVVTAVVDHGWRLAALLRSQEKPATSASGSLPKTSATGFARTTKRVSRESCFHSKQKRRSRRPAVATASRQRLGQCPS